jgi:Dolichyl-phosphate-mannose-protein mannosyltransferase
MSLGHEHLRYLAFLLAPLILSAYTHLWNPLGFPSIHIDEAHYMRRAMLVIEGMGPQESAASGYPRTYDHPYFGQIFLGSVLRLIGYPDILNPSSDQESIESLHMVPRLLMGILAIVDTLLVFKIAERRYGMAVALIASVLFAVMPMSWILRRVYLDTILMPLMLSSILFAVYLKPNDILTKNAEETKRNIGQGTLILLSGIFLGLAIYTKVPVFMMMPLVGALVFFNSKKRLKSLGIWLIPVILIPLLWPLYSVVIGQTDLWVEWVLWQTGRNRPLSTSLTNFFQIDPLITIIGIAGFIWTGLKKDFFPLIWVVPFLVFSYFIGWVQYFHLIVIFPAFCIASAVLLDNLQKFMVKRFRASQRSKILFHAPFLMIAIFGIIISSILINSDVNSSYYKIYASIANNIPDISNVNQKQNANVTVIGSHWWVWDSYWITKYVLNKDHKLIDPHFDPNFKLPVTTNNVIFIDDEIFLDSISRNVRSDNLIDIRQLHDESSIISTFFDNVTSKDNGIYPNNIFSIMILNENHPTGEVVIRRNF